MMQPFEYKAWDKTTKKVRNVLVIDWLNNVVDLTGEVTDRPLEDVVLMQYVGIEDTNGNSIYKDFLIDDGFGRINRVWYKNGMYHIGNWNAQGFMNAFDNFSIVGNIHENPELMKRGCVVD